MGDVQSVKKFEAKVPIAIWRQWEDWLDGRGTLNNTQILVGLLKLFLAQPEEVQLRALFGKPGGLRPSESTETNLDDRRSRLRRLVQDLPREVIEILSPQDQKLVDDIRRGLGPEAAAPKRAKEKRA